MNICDFQATCMKLSKCTVLLDNEHNRVENMVLIPSCYKEKFKLNINEGNVNDRRVIK